MFLKRLISNELLKKDPLNITQKILPLNQLKLTKTKDELNIIQNEYKNASKLLREEINKLYKEKNDLLIESKQKFQLNERDDAKYLSLKSKDCQLKIDLYSKRACDLIFSCNNYDLNNPLLIDLRGLFSNEAIDKLLIRIGNLNNSGNLVIIVGINGENISKLGEKVVEFLNKEGYKYNINDPCKGRVTINLPNNKEINNDLIQSEFDIFYGELPENIAMNEKEREYRKKEIDNLLKSAELNRKKAQDINSTILEYLKKQNEAYLNKNHDLIKEYKAKKEELEKEMKLYNEKASSLFYEAHNKYKDENTLDLHGQYVSEAIELYKKKIETIKNGDLTVIYGAGHHSIDNIQKIKPQILEYLKETNTKYEEIDNATILIHLSSENPIENEKSNRLCIIM